MFLGIGDFARATGLTVKALRWYDEQGVLVPAHVDPVTRYRRYAIGQFERAGLIRALREAGVPVAAVERALRAGGCAPEALRAHRETVLRARAAQDRAFAAAERVLAGRALGYAVRLREIAAQAWVGVVASVFVADELDERDDVDGLDGLDEDGPTAAAEEDADAAVERGLTELYEHLVKTGHAPTGPFWLDFGRTDVTETGSGTRAEIAICLPLAAAVPDDWVVPGRATIRGVRPAGRELTTEHSTAGEDPTAGVAVHPAYAALVRAADERGLTIDPGSLRQHCPRPAAGEGCDDDEEGGGAVVIEMCVDVVP